MGEAKRNAAKRAEAFRLEGEKYRDEFLRETERWSFPPSEWEAAVVASIQTLKPVTVYRPSPEAAAYARMPARACFDNANWFTAQDPARSKAVVGWFEDAYGNFTLHAVNFRFDINEYQDWTPVIGDTRTSFTFIPDPHIIQTKEALEDRDRYHHERDGQKVGYGVRTDPERTIRSNRIIKERILAGMNPFEAASGPFED